MFIKLFRSLTFKDASKLWRILISSFLLLTFQSVHAATLVPSSITESIDVGQTITINRTVTLDRDGGGGTGTGKLDVFFLADNTVSMSGILAMIKANANTIIDALAGDDPRFAGVDVAFGVGSYRGDPSEYWFGSNEVKANSAYQLLQPITTDKALVVEKIGDWIASGGGNRKEGNYFGLHQAATEGQDGGGFASGKVTGWRDDSQAVIVWFGDNPSHTTTLSSGDVISALTDSEVIVAAINTRDSNQGIDEGGQATTIVNGAGGSLQNNVNGIDTVTQAILDALDFVSGNTDLSLSAVGNTAGLNITYTCITPAGCDDVPPGESRTFAMTIEGLTAGIYDFQTVVGGISGLAGNDSVTVSAVIEPPVDPPVDPPVSGSCNCPTTPAACLVTAATDPTLVCGTDQNDILLGRNNLTTTICSYEGNDTIIGSVQNDCIDSGSGNDQVIASNGDDLVFPGSGDNLVFGGVGNDLITAGSGANRIYGGPDDDIINSGAGNDEIYGGPGNDTIDSGTGLDIGDAGPGIDTCLGETTGIKNCEF